MFEMSPTARIEQSKIYAVSYEVLLMGSKLFLYHLLLLEERDCNQGFCGQAWPKKAQQTKLTHPPSIKEKNNSEK